MAKSYASGGALRKLAAGDDNDAFVLALVGWSVADVDDARDASGKSALHHAAWRGHLGNVQAMLKLGVNINAHSTGARCT